MKRLSLSLFFIIASFVARSVPAYPDLVRFSQPDGSQLNIYLRGDERVHWAESEDGYSLLYDHEGYLCYAVHDYKGNLVASSIRATDIAQRPPQAAMLLATTPTKLRYSREQVDNYLAVWNQVAPHDSKNGTKALTGARKALVVLFQTRDCQLHHRLDEFYDLFNQHNYTVNGATGSVYDYYYSASNGLFELQVDVIGPVTGDHTMAYYGSDDSTGSYTFGTEVAQKIEGLANFADYDSDGDGVVDGMHIIFAGHGEEAGAGSSRIWSHAWIVWNAPTYNGITFNRYSCSPELSGSTGNILTNIGVICHELGHVFGAPDYYDTDYAGSGGEYDGLGKWDIMSSGSWNANGRTPARHGAYTATYIYHWTTATELTDPQDVRIEQAGVNHEVYRINTSTDGDFFLLENRQRRYFDNGIPGHGMIVYHVHPNANGSNVSNARHPQQLYIVSPNAAVQSPNNSPSSYGSVNNGAAAYPGTSHRDSITDNSTPWLRPWSETENNTPITGIIESTADSSIFFRFKGGGEPLSPTYIEARYTSEYTASVNWSAIGNNTMLVLASDSPDSFANPDSLYRTGDTLAGGNIVVYSGNRVNHTQFTLDSAQVPDTLYFKVFCALDSTTFLPGPTAMALPYEFFRPQPATLKANYTAERNIDVAWTVSEPCEMLVLMSTDDQFDTPYGSYTEGDITAGGDLVFYCGTDNLAKSYSVSADEEPDTLYFKLFCRTYYDDYSDGINATAIPYEYYRPRVKSVAAAYATYRDIEVSWVVSEPCESLVIMSDDRQFATPYGSYTTGDETEDGDLVLYSGTDTLGARFTIPADVEPTTKYFRVYCRYHGDQYSSGKFATATPIEPEPEPDTQSISSPQVVDFSLRPNPATDRLEITTGATSDGTIILTDVIGRTVATARLDAGHATVDTSTLPRGTYTVVLNASTGRTAKKLVLR